MKSFCCLSLLACLLLAACDPGFAPASRVVGLRLLAVRADHPSAEPGQEVMLEALYHDTKNRQLSWGYAFCDSQTSSAAVDCLKTIDMDTLAVAVDTPRHVFTMPTLAGRGERDSSVGIAVIVCPGEIVPGNTDGLPIACEVNGKPLPLDDFEIGVKRIFYTAEGGNQNPTLDALFWDGEPWDADDVKQVSACAGDSDDVEKCAAKLRHTIMVEAPDAGERFTDTLGVRGVEQAVVQFYATGGSFEWSVRVPESAKTRWVARRKDAGKTLTMFFVVRDSRGGVSWETRQIQVLDAT